MSNHLSQWEICVKDTKRASKFFEELFGWKPVIPENQEFWEKFFDTGKVSGGISQSYEGMPNYLTLFFEVDDAQAFVDKAVSLGATKIIDALEIPGYCFYSMFVDPDGNPIGLLQKI